MIKILDKIIIDGKQQQNQVGNWSTDWLDSIKIKWERVPKKVKDDSKI